jgi:hypothetical protein
MRSFSGQARVVLFEHIEQIPSQAANALLKMIEEPPAHLYFFLTTSNTSQVLSTLCSRSQEWRFERLTQDEVSTVWAQWEEEGKSVFPEHWASFSPREKLLLADGRPSAFTRITLQHDEFEALNLDVDALAKGELHVAQQCAKKLSDHKEKLPEYIEILTTLVRARMQESEAPLLRYRYAELLSDLLELPYLLFQRHLQANLCLTVCLSKFATSARIPYAAKGEGVWEMIQG